MSFDFKVFHNNNDKIIIQCQQSSLNIIIIIESNWKYWDIVVEHKYTILTIFTIDSCKMIFTHELCIILQHTDMLVNFEAHKTNFKQYIIFGQ